MTLIGVKEVMALLCVKESMAYRIIRSLNGELQAKGYLTVSGRVPPDYLRERYHLGGE